MSTDLPLVTVAIVTYQFEDFIERAIDSALAMDWPADRLDVLVVDDGSTDRTPELVAAYGDRVRYLPQDNQGVVAAVSRSFREARGELIAPLAGDDECTVDRLRRQVAVMQARPEVGLLYGDMEVVDASSRTLHASFREAVRLTPQQGRCLGPLLARNTVSGGAALIRTSMLEHVLPMGPEVVWEDWWTAMKVAEVAEIAYLPAPIYRYRLHGRNMNLGAPPEKATANNAVELPFRRWVLSGDAVSLASVTRDDIRLAVLTFDGQAGMVAGKWGCWLHDLIDVSAEDRAAAPVALAAGEPLRALSLDPSLRDARLALDVMEPAQPALTTRAAVTVALARDLIADPSLFHSYAAATGPDDDATLVIYAPGADAAAIQSSLLAAIPALASDSAPDVLLHCIAPSWGAERELLDRATALLRPRTPAALAA